MDTDRGVAVPGAAMATTVFMDSRDQGPAM